MKKFQVELIETVRYIMVVEALDRDAAEEQAEKAWAQSKDPTEDYEATDEGARVEYIDEVSGA